jgi:hypothetical protein
MNYSPALRMAALAFFVCTATTAHAQKPPLTQRAPMVIAPTVEGMYLCDEAVADARIKGIDAA